MGTVLTVAAWGPATDSAALDRALDRAFDSVRVVDALLSTFKDSSEVSRVNRRRDSGSETRVSGAFDAVLAKSLEVARLSDGAFDPTIKNWHGVAFDSLRGRVRLAPGLALDFGGIAKGYALDRAALALAGVADSAILDFGGQYLFLRGTGDGGREKGKTSREVGIADPNNAFRAIALLTLPDTPSVISVSTSSQAEQPGHIRDPRTGHAAAGARSATAVAASGMAADAWSTAFFVLGCERALALARRVGVGLVCVGTDGLVRWSPDLDGRVAVRATDSGGPAGPVPAPAPVPDRAPAGSAPRRRSTGPDS
jgi:thiamine biosynthesis lipoprotein